MALESFGTILYVVKISYQSDNWFGNCKGAGTKILHRHTYTHRHTDTHTHTHTPAAHFISLFFFFKKETRLKRTSLHGVTSRLRRTRWRLGICSTYVDAFRQQCIPGADSEGRPGGPPPPLLDHTTIIKFSGPVLKYFLHSFSIV